MAEFRLEEELFIPLLDYLQQSRRVNSSTIGRKEFPWHGRKVDFATLTKSRVSTAYELKLSDNFGAIEQAIRNSYAFDRSFVVTATYPNKKSLAIAARFGIGVMFVQPEAVRTVLKPNRSEIDKRARARLLEGFRKNGGSIDVQRFV